MLSTETALGGRMLPNPPQPGLRNRLQLHNLVERCCESMARRRASRWTWGLPCSSKFWHRASISSPTSSSTHTWQAQRGTHSDGRRHPGKSICRLRLPCRKSYSDCLHPASIKKRGLASRNLVLLFLRTVIAQPRAAFFFFPFLSFPFLFSFFFSSFQFSIFFSNLFL